MNKNTLIMTILVAFATFGVISSDLYVPSLPHIVQDLSTSALLAKLTITFYLFGLSIAPLFFGPLSDRFGRRPLVLAGGLIGLLGGLMALFAPNIYFLIAARSIQSIGLGGLLAVTRVVASDLYEGSKLAQVVAVFSLIVAFGPAIAPVIGGYMQFHFGWRSVFLLIAFATGILTVMSYYKVPETARSLNPQATQVSTMIHNYKILLSSRYFIVNMIASSMALAAIIVYATLSPFILQQTYHMTAVHYGWSMAAVSAMAVVSRLVNVRLVYYFDSMQIVKIGLLLMTMGAGSMLMLSAVNTHGIIAIIMPAMVMILGTGMVPSNAMANAFAPFRHIAGSVSALYGCLAMFGGFVTTYVASQVPNTTMWMSGLLAFMSAVALMSVMRSRVTLPAANLLM